MVLVYLPTKLGDLWGEFFMGNSTISFDWAIFQFAMLVITRLGKSPLNPIQAPFSYGFPMVFQWFSYDYHSCCASCYKDLWVLRDVRIVNCQHLVESVVSQAGKNPLPD